MAKRIIPCLIGAAIGAAASLALGLSWCEALAGAALAFAVMVVAEGLS